MTIVQFENCLFFTHFLIVVFLKSGNILQISAYDNKIYLLRFANQITTYILSVMPIL